jgi:dethiobiotin synthase
VTGTDTGVGKTVVCAALMHRFRDRYKLRYWKPIQTGVGQDDDTAEVFRLGGCSKDEVLNAGIRLSRPVSPHLAAKSTGTTIDLHRLADSMSSVNDDTRWIVEGAGGVLVPINETELMIDLMRSLALPVLVASRTSLGTINHTLLTLEALRRRSLSVAGVVMVGAPNAENRQAIEQYGDLPVLGELPCLESLTSAALASIAPTLDSRGRLLELLQ